MTWTLFIFDSFDLLVCYLFVFLHLEFFLCQSLFVSLRITQKVLLSQEQVKTVVLIHLFIVRTRKFTPKILFSLFPCLVVFFPKWNLNSQMCLTLESITVAWKMYLFPHICINVWSLQRFPLYLFLCKAALSIMTSLDSSFHFTDFPNTSGKNLK